MIWVIVALVGGYLLRNIPFIRNYIGMLTLIIVLVYFRQLLPLLKQKKRVVNIDVINREMDG